jgi:hypothetical protein
MGLRHNDLFVSLSKSSSGGPQLHGFLALLCLAGSLMFSIELITVPDA